ncbi:MAG TPA: DegT/DnrJ/EryC1/StrS family aminotransferase [Acidobacteriaceae bacterium]|nr:DegT/DnrJ/EryC1/StrS family aminotransferase [Acidobacteriaceae bacterium]
MVLPYPDRERISPRIPFDGSIEVTSSWRVALLKIPTLDLSREYRLIAPLLLDAIEAVLSQQKFILGDEVVSFENAAAARCGARHGIGCASGTDALWLALAAAGIGPDDAVVTTPFSFFATVSSILRANARPLLADIDPETFNLAPESVRSCLNASSAVIRAILPVHLFGQTADWDAFESLQQEYSREPAGLMLIEDAAQAFGACWDSRPAGSLGEAAAFSFYPTKNLSASGDAGMVTVSGDRLAERVRMLRAHGMRRRYYHEEVGWNSRLDTLQAAVLLVKLRFIDEWNEQRRALAANYDALLRRAGIADSGLYPEHGVVLPRTRAKAKHVYHQYVIRVRRRDDLKEFLALHGVGSEVYYPVPLHLQPALKNLGYKRGAFPESERAAEEVLALPIFPQLTTEEQEIVVARIADFLS